MDISNNAFRKLENVLHCGVLLPLQEIALRRVAASFCIDILLSTKRTPFHLIKFGEMVKDKASKVLPALLKERIIYIVSNLRPGILSWIMYHRINLRMSKDANLTTLNHLHWTNKGSIDYKKTAKNIIQLERFSVEMRYKLACLNCLEDDIRILWEKLPKESKKNFREEIKVGLDMQLEHYWAYLLSGEEYKLDIALKKQLSFNQFAFEASAVSGNKAATEYFFQKLTNEERVYSLLTTFKAVIMHQDKPFSGCIYVERENLSVVLCYLLTQMRPEMQIKVLTLYPCHILSYFLDWPLKDLFMQVANFIWTFLPERQYRGLVLRMNDRIRGYCPDTFREFFLTSPCTFRKEFVNYECGTGRLLSKFFDMQDSETVKVIFENIDVPDRVRLVFSECIFKLLCKFISTPKWHMVEVCLQEAKLSNEDRQRLEKNFLKFLATTDGGVSVKETACEWQRMCEPINEACMKSSEESSDDETLSRVKKLCSEKKANVLQQI